jgi:hypothetical protein
MSLTTTAYSSRLIIKFGSIGLGAFLVLWTLMIAGIKAWQAAHPPYVAPTVRWGRIPAIVFPEKSFEKKNFSLEVANDSLPKFKDQAKVYMVYHPTSSFLALESDSQTARDMGFTGEAKEIKPSIYEFRNESLNQTLTMNVLDGSFKLEYPYLTDQLLQNPDKLPDKNSSIALVKSFLETANKYHADLENGEKKISYWVISYDGLKSVPSLSEANVVRVDLFRQPIDDAYKILSTEPNRSPISILLSGSNADSRKVIEANYKYVKIDRESFSTYPIKTSQEAYKELASGNYWPAVDTSTSNVAIRKVYLAYFEPVTLTNFLQPIYVFEGSNNFVAYVPAVKDNMIKN